MEYVYALILGIVQGATEFIPVSSSGHLILVRDALGIETVGMLGFDAVLQLATSLAILVYFWDEWKKLILYVFEKGVGRFVRPRVSALEGDSRGSSLIMLIIATIPAIILGLLLEEYMETLFRSSSVVIVTLIAGSILMALAEYKATKTPKDEVLTRSRAFGIGLFQSLALIPGMSRSGSTISGGLLLGLTREGATRFAFMLGFPILFGSGIVKLADLFSSGELRVLGGELLLGSVTAFLVGLWAIGFLIRYLRTRTLVPFIIYRVILALVLISIGV